jgi:hypothetical protein
MAVLLAYLGYVKQKNLRAHRGAQVNKGETTV